jgi:hypothetical protein
MLTVSVAAMMKHVQQRAGQDEQEWKRAEKMSAVFGPQEIACNGQEADQCPFPPAFGPLGAAMLMHVVHGSLPSCVGC